MSSKDKKLWITFNGEIYNFQDLRKDLLSKGYSFESNTDTEVLLYLYQEYGENCLEYLRGMFAFAIWDANKNILFIARDRIGKKPVFYFYDGKTIVFASEIKAILKDPSIKREMNYEALYDYLLNRKNELESSSESQKLKVIIDASGEGGLKFVIQALNECVRAGLDDIEFATSRTSIDEHFDKLERESSGTKQK